MSTNVILVLCIIGVLFILCLVSYILFKHECEHDMLYKGYKSEWNPKENYTWSVRKYECQKCGHIEYVDARYNDPYFPKAWKH